MVGLWNMYGVQQQRVPYDRSKGETELPHALNGGKDSWSFICILHALT